MAVTYKESFSATVRTATSYFQENYCIKDLHGNLLVKELMKICLHVGTSLMIKNQVSCFFETRFR